METGKTILILARTSTLRMGLQALLLSISREHRILLAEDSERAFELIKDKPALLALLEDDRTGGKVWDVVREMKRLSPQTKCIVLLENVQPQVAGQLADAVILQGTSPEQLVATIENLLEEPPL